MDYIYNNGELYHARQYSHKYIKREWKNGRWHYVYPADGTFYQVGTNGYSPGAQKAHKFAQRSNKASEFYREGLKENQRDYKNKLASESKKRNAAKVNLAAHSDPKKYVDNYVNSTRGKYLKVSKEYLNALASNSRKNDYFGKGSNPGIVRFESTRPKRVSNKDRVKNWLRDKLGWK